MSGANSLVGTLVTSVGSKGGSLCNLGTYGYNWMSPPNLKFDYGVGQTCASPVFFLFCGDFSQTGTDTIVRRVENETAPQFRRA